MSLTSLLMTLSTLAVLATKSMRSAKDNWPKTFFECRRRGSASPQRPVTANG